MTGKRNKSSRLTEGSESNSDSTDSLFERDRKRRKIRHNRSESSSSDTDCPICDDRKRKKSARRAEGSESNSDSTDSLFERDRKRRKIRHNRSESSSSDTDCPVPRPAMTGKKKKSAMRTVVSESNSDSTDSLFERDRKRRKIRHNRSESSSSDTDCPVPRPAMTEVRRTVGTDDKSYESQPGRGDECGSSDEGQEVTGHTSVLYPCNERNNNYSENLLKTKMGSEKVATVSETGVLLTSKDRDTEAALSLSTSSRATADMSDDNNNEHLTESPICIICR
ncbi:dentin sialophosphoprotein-like [Cryptotermes secundus]|uniref:dentin sialophosphoprotein-like n=1 Tax=Cryptotermes secundus TaxID=105785 RepID=UPI000CD7C3BC|nr:dentin sialophosphoprotein-like [Cryptotermes secundus]